MKTRSKLFIVFLLMSLVPLLVTSLVSYFLLRGSINKNVTNQLEAVASAQYTRLADFIDKGFERIAIVASRTQLRNSLADYNQGHNPQSQEQMNTILRDTASSLSAYKDIAVLDMSGIVVASTKPSLIGKDESGKSYFRESKNGKSNIAFFQGDDKVLMQHLSGPLILNGSQIGVVLIDVEAKELTAMVTDYTGLGSTGETLVAMKDDNGDALFIHALRFDRNAAFSRTVDKELVDVPISIALSGKAVLVSDAPDYRGNKVIAVTRYIKNPGLGLVVKREVGEAFASTGRLRNILILVLLLTMVLVISASIFLSESITRPIIDLTEVAEDISEGDFSKRADEKAPGEVGILAIAFNKMTVHLAEARDNLEDKVRKRTKALKATTESLEHEIAERELYQKILEESEARYRDLFDNAGDLIQTIDPEGNFLYVNPMWKKTLGYSDEEIKSLKLFDILDPGCIEECTEIFKSALSGERPGRREATFIAKDGHKVIVEGEISCRFEDGVPVNTRGIFHDITERKAAEEHINRLAALVKSSEDAIISKDLDGTIKSWNLGAQKIYGYSPEEVIGKNISILEPEDHAGETSRILERIRNGETVETLDTTRLTRDGREVFISITISPVKDDLGNITGASAVARDISERVRALAALAESEEMFRTAASTAKDAIVLIDDDDRIMFWNLIAEKLFMYSEQEAMGKELHPLIAPPYYLDAYREGFARFRQSGKGDAVGKTLELEGLRRNGDIFPIELSLSSIILGGSWHALGIIRDITDRKEAEAELQRINTELEGFAHTVSHDLKGPLAAIMIAADTMKELAGNPDEPEALEMMDNVVNILESNVLNASKLIEDLLSLAEAGQKPLDIEDLVVRGIVDRIIEERKSDIDRLGIKLETDEDLGRIKGSYTQIYQVFTNLMSNAIKHGISDKPVFRISYLGDNEDGGHRYLFRDNGEGIAEEDMDKIFNPFYKGKSGGTGIGLATVMKIVELYGGNIKAYNDSGACFEFTLYDYPG